MGSKVQRFKIIIKPDLSDASLHVINMSKIISDDLIECLYRVYGGYRICEDSLVCFWKNRFKTGAYAGLISAPFTNVVTRWNGPGYIKSLCPASGRYVCCSEGRSESIFSSKLVVVDLF